MESSDLLKLILFAVALLVSAFFSGSEAAYLSIQRGKLAALMKSDPKKATRIDRLASNPEKLLSTVLTGNNLANTSAAALATGLLLSYLSPSTAVLASTLGVTVLLLIFAEAIPKTIAARYSVGVAYLVAIPLKVVEMVLIPAVWLLERLVRGITAILGLPTSHIVSQEEIIALVDIGKQSGALAEAQAQMVDQVFQFADMDLQEVMTHRTKMKGISKGSSLSDFYRIYLQDPHSRYPVFEGSSDSIVGVVSSSEVLSALAGGQIELDSEVTALMQAPYFLPENRMMGDVFRHLEGTGHGIVFLVDEYGGITGLVTVKQMVQGIVGRIGDETDDVMVPINVNMTGATEVDASMHVDDVAEQFGIEIPEGEYDTLAGFILMQVGVMPTVGESIEHDGYILEVKRMDGLQIGRVGITKLENLDSDWVTQ